MLRGGNEDVDPPHPPKRRLAKHLEIGRACDVAGYDNDPRGGKRGQFVKPASISGKDDELCTFADEFLDDRASQHTAGSCHDRDLVQQPLCHRAARSSSTCRPPL